MKNKPESQYIVIKKIIKDTVQELPKINIYVLIKFLFYDS